MIVIGAGIILIPGVPLFPVLFLSQVLNGLLLPFVLVFMSSSSTGRTSWATYVNGRVWNWVAWGTCGVMVLLTLVLVVATIWPGLFPVHLESPRNAGCLRQPTETTRVLTGGRFRPRVP